MEKFFLNTSSEERALIPDKWVIGRGLSTSSCYALHTGFPLMIVQYPYTGEGGEKMPSHVYVSGDLDPEALNKLFKEAWELLGIYTSIER